MGKMSLPPAPETQYTVYGNLKGVDFSVDPSLVSSNRSPLAVNMISGFGGDIRRRVGWRILLALDGPIHDIWYGEIDGVDKYIAHAGTKIYALNLTDNTSIVLKTGIANKKGTAFFMRHNNKGAIFISTGDEYLIYDGTTVKSVTEVAYIPTIVISRSPTGGGTTYEPVNLLQAKRKESFLGDSSNKVYQLTATNITSVNEIKTYNSSGELITLVSGTDYTVNLTTGKITFEDYHPPLVNGQDNVFVTYTKTITGYADRINKCTISVLYGFNATNRVFLSGNPSYKAYDWYSQIDDPTYLPDINYSIVGTNDTSIMGYRKIGEYLCIIKEDNEQDTTVFLRYGEFVDGKTVFRLKQGIAGIGAISKGCFATLGDEPLFLSRTGVYAITSTLLSYERSTKNRSFFVDAKLTKESDLENAVACVFNNYYILCVNERCYVLDGRNKTGSNSNNDFIYECFYWENIPAVCFLSINGELFFGTSDGNICKFNTDIEGIDAYNDNDEAITAVWATPNDNDGCTQYFKNLMKKGSLATLHPYQRSSAKVYFSVDGNPRKFVTESFMDILNWNDIDFNRFTFDSNEGPRECYFNMKEKKYTRLQIIITNDVVNEGFGIHEIVKTYTVGNFSKNKGAR